MKRRQFVIWIMGRMARSWRKAMADVASTNKHRARNFAFGEFVFDAHRRDLRRNGDRVELKPQPARLLETLLLRAPDVIARDELQRELWGGKATVEFEQGLNTCIGQLRVALGDSARDPVYIKTEPKIGYRILTPVKAESGEPLGARIALAALSLVGVAGVVLAFIWFVGTSAPSGPLKASSPTIHEAILKARALRIFGDPEAMGESLVQFEGALARAPEEPAAMAGAALNLAVLAGQKDHPVPTTYARANELAAAALQRNERAVDALLARGFIALYDRWDVEAARRDFERARRLAPDYPLAHAWLAAAYGAGGDSARAAASANKAAELDPASWYVQADRCWYLLYDRAFANALEACAGAAELRPDLLWSQFALVEAHRSVRDFDAAAAQLAKIAVRIGPENAPASNDAKLRFEAISCAMAEQLVERGGASNYLIAVLYAQCGRLAEAAPWLEKAVAGGESFALFYALDPRFDAYRSSEAARAAPVIIAKRQTKQPLDIN